MLSSILVERRGRTLDTNAHASAFNAALSTGETSTPDWPHKEKACFSVQYAAANVSAPWSAVATAAARFHKEAANEERMLMSALIARCTSLSSVASSAAPAGGVLGAT